MDDFNCNPENMKLLIAAIYGQAVRDYQTALLRLHNYPNDAKARETADECEEFLSDIEPKFRAIEISKRRVDYILFRREHKCTKCRLKKCPHASRWDGQGGKFSQFGKVGCLKDENCDTRL